MQFTKVDFNDSIDDFSSALLQDLVINQVKPDIINFFKNQYYVLVNLQYEKLLIDFTISYHDIYQVPIAYFRVYDQVTASTLWTFESLASSCQKLGFDTKVPVNIEPHHILQQSWWMVHPCETKLYMSQFDLDDLIQYMVMWWSIYGLSGVFRNIILRTDLSRR